MVDSEPQSAEVPEQGPSGAIELLERTIAGVLDLLSRFVHTNRIAGFSPHVLARRIAAGDAELAPPFSFLILSLVLGGIGVRLGVAFFEHGVDYTVLSRLAETFRAMSLEDAVVLTVPGVVLVALTGVGTARITGPKMSLKMNPIVHGVCYAAGLQFSVIGSSCIAGLFIKALSGQSQVVSAKWFDQFVLVAIVLLLLLSSRCVACVIRQSSTRRSGSSWTRRNLLSLVSSTSVLVGVAIVNAVCFDLESTIAEARQRQQHRMLADVYIGAKTLSSRFVRMPQGGLAMEMKVALVNVSETDVLVPQPFELDYAFDPQGEPLRILSYASDGSRDAGWVLKPSETRVVQWIVTVPDWCRREETHHTGLPVTFHCFPFLDTKDLLHRSPIGERSLVYAELSWPLSEAWKWQDRKKVAQLLKLLR